MTFFLPPALHGWLTSITFLFSGGACFPILLTHRLVRWQNFWLLPIHWRLFRDVYCVICSVEFAVFCVTNHRPVLVICSISPGNPWYSVWTFKSCPTQFASCCNSEGERSYLDAWCLAALPVDSNVTIKLCHGDHQIWNPEAK